MLKSSLCDYSDADIIAGGTIKVAPQAGDNKNNVHKKEVYKKCATFTDYISEISNTQIHNAKDIDVVVPIYNLIEYSDNYSKRGSLWQYYRDRPVLTNASAITIFSDTENSALFKFRRKKQVKLLLVVRKNVEIMVPWKYLSNLWRTLAMP